MARIRTIKPDFFFHEDLFDAEKKSKLPLRLSFISIWTIADREGRFQWRPRSMRAKCLPYDTDIDFGKVLEALANGRFIVKYEVEGEAYGAIPKWNKHQIPTTKEAKSRLPPPTDEALVIIKAQEEEKPSESAKAPVVNDPFDLFWSAYPKRKGDGAKMAARKIFLKCLAAGIEAEAIIAGAKRYTKEMKAENKIGTEYVAMAKSWLNQERWISGEPEKTTPKLIFFPVESDQWKAWDVHLKALRGRGPLVDEREGDRKRGSWFETELPPSLTQSNEVK